MGNAHVSREVRDALPVLKHLGRHAIALALEYPTTGRAGGNAAGILTAVLEVVETLMQVDGGVGARRVGEDETDNATHVAGSGCNCNSAPGVGWSGVEGRLGQKDRGRNDGGMGTRQLSVEGIDRVGSRSRCCPFDTRQKAPTVQRSALLWREMERRLGQTTTSRITSYSPPWQEGQG